MKLYVAFTIILLAAVFSYAFGRQRVNPVPTSIGLPQSSNTAPAIPRNPASSGSDADGLAQRARINQHLRFKYVDPLYRKPTDEELKAVSVDPAVKTKFAAFLAVPNSGILKLVPDLGCSEHVSVVSTTPECSKYTMPGAGNAFSFRTATYRIRRLADISISGESLFLPGEMLQGVVVRLGDVPIENISLSSPAMDVLANIRLADDAKSLALHNRGSGQGIDVNGFHYSRSVRASANTTYAVRSIAYRGRLIRSVQGVAYNELEYDKRRDVTVVIRIVAIDADGALTIVWRILKNAESPKLKI